MVVYYLPFQSLMLGTECGTWHTARTNWIRLFVYIILEGEKRDFRKEKRKKKVERSQSVKKFLLYERFWLAGCFLFDDLKGRESSYIIYKNKAYLIYFVKQWTRDTMVSNLFLVIVTRIFERLHEGKATPIAELTLILSSYWMYVLYTHLKYI